MAAGDDLLAVLYAQVPEMGCKGLCSSTCLDPIPVYETERDRLAALAGGEIPEPREPWTCPFLRDGACTVYEHRPLVCRVHGTVDLSTVPPEGAGAYWNCPHGCTPTRWLTFDDFGALLKAFDPFTIRALDNGVDRTLADLRARGVRIYGFGRVAGTQKLIIYAEDGR